MTTEERVFAALMKAAKELIAEIEDEYGPIQERRLHYDNGEDAQFDPLIYVRQVKALADAVDFAERSLLKPPE